jgi:hypothetical protein
LKFQVNNMSVSASQPQTTPPHVAIFQLMNGAYVAGTIACLAELGIPDLVEDGPKTAAELAAQIGADPQALYRLMRATASVGVLSEDPNGKFSQTPMSSVLRSDANPSLRAWAAMNGREWHARGWGNLAYCVRTGKQALDKIYGQPIFEYFTQHSEEASIFNQAMTDLSALDGPAVAEAYSFEGIHSIVDVAGGHGSLLAEVLKRNPQLRGTLFEMPHVVEGAKNGLLKPYMDRCSCVSGDIFTEIPSGSDAYLMKHIIHDWPDDRCVQILQACRKAVNPGGKVLVVDNVIEPGNAFAPGKFLDIQMLIFPGGRERTEKEFGELFAASGWRLTRIIPTTVPESIVEGIPV